MIEDFSESEYPVFPVMFTSPTNEPPPSKGSQDDNELLKLIAVTHQSTYPELFREVCSLEGFFKVYRPLSRHFLEEFMKKKLSIRRLSAYSLYVGEYAGDSYSGSSVVVFKNGNIYEGEMLNGQRDGKGIYLDCNVGWYEGDFHQDAKHGQGLEVHYNQHAYRGTFQNGLRHDEGTYVDGKSVYVGSWKLGIMHGTGLLCTEGNSYQGQFVNALKHGFGEEKFSNGDMFKGEYANHRFNGYGTYTWKDGGCYEGNFKNGLRNGKGKWSVGETKYSGAYLQNLKEGYGELYFPSGNFYKGNFVEDKREGYGQMFWTDGSFYKGEWRKGTQNGKGQIYLAGGELVSGVFENSMLVQVTPSIYEKQMEISTMGIEDVFGSKKEIGMPRKLPTNGSRFDLSPPYRGASLPRTRKLGKVDARHAKNNIYYRSPEETNGHNVGHMGHKHNMGQDRECKCVRRLEHFRLRNKPKAVLLQ